MPAANRTNPVSPPQPPETRRARRDILARWRRLTGGGRDEPGKRRTLIACSGGADSTALAITLASATSDLVLAHIRHDFRPAPETAADLAAVDRLAATLGLPVAHESIAIADAPGNAEANARRARYAALERLADHAGCPFIATAHHADDQLETLIMRLARGSGVRGLSGIVESRPTERRTLIRPMLGIERALAEAICTERGIAWREDATNRDLSRTRAALRANVLPELKRIVPGASGRAAETAAVLAATAAWLDTVAADALEHARGETDTGGADLPLVCARLAPLPEVLLGEVIRRAAREAAGGRGADRLPRRMIDRVAQAIREQPGPPRRFTSRFVEIQVRRGIARFGARPEEQP
ncbi:MAG: tRNA lysidine(34) synthetase TilS [Phycisphaerales bacterium JB037]